MRILPIALVAGLMAGQAASAQDCTPISFDPGSSGAYVDDTVPAEGGLCYTLSVRPGQQAHVGIVGGDDNVAVSVWDIADNRRNIDFVTTSDLHTIYVHQTLRSPRAEAFSMLIQVR